MDFIVTECMTEGCGAHLPGQPGVYYCEGCIAKQLAGAKAEQEAHTAIHGRPDPYLQAEIEGRI